MIDYEFIKAEARRRRKAGESCSVQDLIALSVNNDPFYQGTKSDLEKAQWFKDLWQRFGYREGVHLRRIHYQVVSQDPPIKKPDGKPYENTERNWAYLNIASKVARYLGYVPAKQFEDRRNPDPTIYASYDDSDLGVWVRSRAWDSLPLPEFGVYGERENLQPFHIELWVEKTTMNDVLLPICTEYGVNLVTGAGELSITAVIDFLARVGAAQRPAIILYISDFDPAGNDMPISVARKIEFYQRGGRCEGVDIALQPIALTAAQVAGYDLPRVPVKDSDMRKSRWVESHGKGQVELDALEALHPGALTQIVECEILKYYDTDIGKAQKENNGKLSETLDNARREVLEQHHDEIKDLTAKAKELQQAIAEKLQGALNEVDLSEYELSKPDAQIDTNGLLYDSKRGYFKQLDYYKAQRDGIARGI